MEKQEFINTLKNKSEKLNILLNDKQLDNFYKYYKILVQWNEKMNLTAITEPQEVILKHFIDSMSLAPYINGINSILDIGTGAGFPGIPLRIITEEQEITLLDSLNKRVIFLNEVIKELDLKRIHAIHGRAEDFIKENEQRENYDMVVSRAVAKLNVLVEYMLPFTKIGGICICMKSNEVEEEIFEAKNAIKLLGGKIESIDNIMLPESDIVRKIIVIKKIENTPSKYPRKAGMPTKEPIK